MLRKFLKEFVRVLCQSDKIFGKILKEFQKLLQNFGQNFDKG